MSLALNPVAFDLGPIQVKWYGILMATGVLVATLMAINEGKKRQIMPDDFIDFLLWAVPIGFIGARIYYVVFEWGYFSQHPDQIIAIWNGGIAIYGGLIAGLIVLLVFCHQRMLPPFLMLDIIAPGVMAAQVIARWGNFMNQEAHGGPVTRQFLENLYLPEFIIEQMNINGTYYHPTFLYESLWSLLGFVLIVTIRNRKQLLRQGEVALSYVLWYSVGRFFIEGMRTDSLWIGEWIRVSQALSLALFIGAIVV